MSVDIIVRFLILEGKATCLFTISHRFFCRCLFIRFRRVSEWFYRERVLDFGKYFFWDYWDDNVVFVFDSVDMNWFSDSKLILHFWDKPHVVMVYNSFLCCYLLDGQYLVEDFIYIFMRNIGLQFSPNYLIFHIRIKNSLTDWVGKCSLLFYFFFWKFLWKLILIFL